MISALVGTGLLIPRLDNGAESRQSRSSLCLFQHSDWRTLTRPDVRALRGSKMVRLPLGRCSLYTLHRLSLLQYSDYLANAVLLLVAEREPSYMVQSVSFADSELESLREKEEENTKKLISDPRPQWLNSKPILA